MGGWGGRGGIIIRTFREHARPFCLIFDCNHERNTLSKEGPRTRKNGIVFSENKTFYLGRRKKNETSRNFSTVYPPLLLLLNWSHTHRKNGGFSCVFVSLLYTRVPDVNTCRFNNWILRSCPPMKEKKKKNWPLRSISVFFSFHKKKKIYFQTFYFPVPSLIIWKYQGYKLIQTLWHAPPVARFSVVPLGNASPVRKSEGGGETSAAVAKL